MRSPVSHPLSRLHRLHDSLLLCAALSPVEGTLEIAIAWGRAWPGDLGRADSMDAGRAADAVLQAVLRERRRRRMSSGVDLLDLLHVEMWLRADGSLWPCRRCPERADVAAPATVVCTRWPRLRLFLVFMAWRQRLLWLKYWTLCLVQNHRKIDTFLEKNLKQFF